MAGVEFQPIDPVGHFMQGAQQAQRNKLANEEMELRKNVFAANQQQDQQKFNADQQKQIATMIYQASQYAIQQDDPKAFVEQNYPQLAQIAGPQWATMDKEGVRAKLKEGLGVWGPKAGIGPPEAKGKNGALYKYMKDGKPVYGDADAASGQTPYLYEAPEAGERVPSGYRQKGDGSLEPIPGGPADPNTPNTRDDTRIFAKADKLRDEFNTQSKDFITVNDAYNQVRAVAANPSAAGDLSMIFSFMKMLDPNSVVREQEFANAQNAAGVPDRIANQYNKLLSGERLNPAQRADFIKQAENLYKTRKGRQDSIAKRYTEIAKRNKVNPDDVVGDLGVALGTPATDDDDAILRKWSQ